MELNKIIRRSGITSSAIYSKFIADLTDALKDVTGITKEEVKENKDADGTLKENAHTRFYLGTSKKNYIKIVNNGNSGMRVQFTGFSLLAPATLSILTAAAVQLRIMRTISQKRHMELCLPHYLIFLMQQT